MSAGQDKVRQGMNPLVIRLIEEDIRVQIARLNNEAGHEDSSWRRKIRLFTSASEKAELLQTALENALAYIQEHPETDLAGFLNHKATSESHSINTAANIPRGLITDAAHKVGIDVSTTTKTYLEHPANLMAMYILRDTLKGERGSALKELRSLLKIVDDDLSTNVTTKAFFIGVGGLIGEEENAEHWAATNDGIKQVLKDCKQFKSDVKQRMRYLAAMDFILSLKPEEMFKEENSAVAITRQRDKALADIDHINDEFIGECPKVKHDVVRATRLQAQHDINEASTARLAALADVRISWLDERVKDQRPVIQSALTEEEVNAVVEALKDETSTVVKEDIQHFPSEQQACLTSALESAHQQIDGFADARKQRLIGANAVAERYFEALAQANQLSETTIPAPPTISSGDVSEEKLTKQRSALSQAIASLQAIRDELEKPIPTIESIGGLGDALSMLPAHVKENATTAHQQANQNRASTINKVEARCNELQQALEQTSNAETVSAELKAIPDPSVELARYTELEHLNQRVIELRTRVDGIKTEATGAYRGMLDQLKRRKISAIDEVAQYRRKEIQVGKLLETLNQVKTAGLQRLNKQTTAAAAGKAFRDIEAAIKDFPQQIIGLGAGNTSLEAQADLKVSEALNELTSAYKQRLRTLSSRTKQQIIDNLASEPPTFSKYNAKYDIEHAFKERLAQLDTLKIAAEEVLPEERPALISEIEAQCEEITSAVELRLAELVSRSQELEGEVKAVSIEVFNGCRTKAEVTANFKAVQQAWSSIIERAQDECPDLIHDVNEAVLARTSELAARRDAHLQHLASSIEAKIRAVVADYSSCNGREAVEAIRDDNSETLKVLASEILSVSETKDPRLKAVLDDKAKELEELAKARVAEFDSTKKYVEQSLKAVDVAIDELKGIDTPQGLFDVELTIKKQLSFLLREKLPWVAVEDSAALAEAIKAKDKAVQKAVDATRERIQQAIGAAKQAVNGYQAALEQANDRIIEQTQALAVVVPQTPALIGEGMVAAWARHIQALENLKAQLLATQLGASVEKPAGLAEAQAYLVRCDERDAAVQQRLAAAEQVCNEARDHFEVTQKTKLTELGGLLSEAQKQHELAMELVRAQDVVSNYQSLLTAREGEMEAVWEQLTSDELEVPSLPTTTKALHALLETTQKAAIEARDIATEINWHVPTPDSVMDYEKAIEILSAHGQDPSSLLEGQYQALAEKSEKYRQAFEQRAQALEARATEAQEQLQAMANAKLTAIEAIKARVGELDGLSNVSKVGELTQSLEQELSAYEKGNEYFTTRSQAEISNAIAEVNEEIAAKAESKTAEIAQSVKESLSSITGAELARLADGELEEFADGLREQARNLVTAAYSEKVPQDIKSALDETILRVEKGLALRRAALAAEARQVVARLGAIVIDEPITRAEDDAALNSARTVLEKQIDAAVPSDFGKFSEDDQQHIQAVADKLRAGLATAVEKRTAQLSIDKVVETGLTQPLPNFSQYNTGQKIGVAADKAIRRLTELAEKITEASPAKQEEFSRRAEAQKTAVTSLAQSQLAALVQKSKDLISGVEKTAIDVFSKCRSEDAVNAKFYEVKQVLERFIRVAQAECPDHAAGVEAAVATRKEALKSNQAAQLQQLVATLTADIDAVKLDLAAQPSQANVVWVMRKPREQLQAIQAVVDTTFIKGSTSHLALTSQVSAKEASLAQSARLRKAQLVVNTYEARLAQLRDKNKAIAVQEVPPLTDKLVTNPDIATRINQYRAKAGALDSLSATVTGEIPPINSDVNASLEMLGQAKQAEVERSYTEATRARAAASTKVNEIKSQQEQVQRGLSQAQRAIGLLKKINELSVEFKGCMGTEDVENARATAYEELGRIERQFPHIAEVDKPQLEVAMAKKIGDIERGAEARLAEFAAAKQELEQSLRQLDESIRAIQKIDTPQALAATGERVKVQLNQLVEKLPSVALEDSTALEERLQAKATALEVTVDARGNTIEGQIAAAKRTVSEYQAALQQETAQVLEKTKALAEIALPQPPKSETAASVAAWESHIQALEQAKKVVKQINVGKKVIRSDEVAAAQLYLVKCGASTDASPWTEAEQQRDRAHSGFAESKNAKLAELDRLLSGAQKQHVRAKKLKWAQSVVSSYQSDLAQRDRRMEEVHKLLSRAEFQVPQLPSTDKELRQVAELSRRAAPSVRKVAGGPQWKVTSLKSIAGYEAAIDILKQHGPDPSGQLESRYQALVEKGQKYRTNFSVRAAEFEARATEADHAVAELQQKAADRLAAIAAIKERENELDPLVNVWQVVENAKTLRRELEAYTSGKEHFSESAQRKIDQAIAETKEAITAQVKAKTDAITQAVKSQLEGTAGAELAGLADGELDEFANGLGEQARNLVTAAYDEKVPQDITHALDEAIQRVKDARASRRAALAAEASQVVVSLGAIVIDEPIAQAESEAALNSARTALESKIAKAVPGNLEKFSSGDQQQIQAAAGAARAALATAVEKRTAQLSTDKVVEAGLTQPLLDFSQYNTGQKIEAATDKASRRLTELAEKITEASPAKQEEFRRSINAQRSTVTESAQARLVALAQKSKDLISGVEKTAIDVFSKCRSEDAVNAKFDEVQQALNSFIGRAQAECPDHIDAVRKAVAEHAGKLTGHRDTRLQQLAATITANIDAVTVDLTAQTPQADVVWVMRKPREQLQAIQAVVDATFNKGSTNHRALTSHVAAKEASLAQSATLRKAQLVVDAYEAQLAQLRDKNKEIAEQDVPSLTDELVTDRDIAARINQYRAKASALDALSTRLTAVIPAPNANVNASLKVVGKDKQREVEQTYAEATEARAAANAVIDNITSQQEQVQRGVRQAQQAMGLLKKINELSVEFKGCRGTEEVENARATAYEELSRIERQFSHLAEIDKPRLQDAMLNKIAAIERGAEVRLAEFAKAKQDVEHSLGQLDEAIKALQKIDTPQALAEAEVGGRHLVQALEQKFSQVAAEDSEALDRALKAQVVRWSEAVAAQKESIEAKIEASNQTVSAYQAALHQEIASVTTKTKALAAIALPESPKDEAATSVDAWERHIQALEQAKKEVKQMSVGQKGIRSDEVAAAQLYLVGCGASTDVSPWTEAEQQRDKACSGFGKLKSVKLAGLNGMVSEAQKQHGRAKLLERAQDVVGHYQQLLNNRDVEMEVMHGLLSERELQVPSLPHDAHHLKALIKPCREAASSARQAARGPQWQVPAPTSVAGYEAAIRTLATHGQEPSSRLQSQYQALAEKSEKYRQAFEQRAQALEARATEAQEQLQAMANAKLTAIETIKARVGELDGLSNVSKVGELTQSLVQELSAYEKGNEYFTTRSQAEISNAIAEVNEEITARAESKTAEIAQSVKESLSSITGAELARLADGGLNEFADGLREQARNLVTAAYSEKVPKDIKSALDETILRVEKGLALRQAALAAEARQVVARLAAIKIDNSIGQAEDDAALNSAHIELARQIGAVEQSEVENFSDSDQADIKQAADKLRAALATAVEKRTAQLSIDKVVETGLTQPLPNFSQYNTGQKIEVAADKAIRLLTELAEKITEASPAKQEEFSRRAEAQKIAVSDNAQARIGALAQKAEALIAEVESTAIDVFSECRSEDAVNAKFAEVQQALNTIVTRAQAECPDHREGIEAAVTLRQKDLKGQRDARFQRLTEARAQVEDYLATLDSANVVNQQIIDQVIPAVPLLGSSLEQLAAEQLNAHIVSLEQANATLRALKTELSSKIKTPEDAGLSDALSTLGSSDQEQVHSAHQEAVNTRDAAERSAADIIKRQKQVEGDLRTAREHDERLAKAALAAKEQEEKWRHIQAEEEQRTDVVSLYEDEDETVLTISTAESGFTVYGAVGEERVTNVQEVNELFERNSLPDEEEWLIKINYPDETVLDKKQVEQLKSEQGITITSPSKQQYQFTMSEGNVPRAKLMKSQAKQLKGEGDNQYHQRLAVTVVNMIDNVLAKGDVVHIKTKDPFVAKIAQQYLEYLKQSHRLQLTEVTINGRECLEKAVNVLGDRNKEDDLITRAEKVFSKLKARDLDNKLHSESWFKEAKRFHKQLRRTVQEENEGQKKPGW